MLYLSWFLKDYKYELLAYEGIQLNYFYLGDPRKASHYGERVTRGKTENSVSVVRQVAVEIVKTVFGCKDMVDSQLLKPDFKRIPSPSAYAKSSASNV
jgi:hypothetical protein